MSLFGSIQLANNALQANQIGLQVTGQNIANANTPGYSREEVILTPAPTQRQGSLLLGLGRGSPRRRSGHRRVSRTASARRSQRRRQQPGPRTGLHATGKHAGRAERHRPEHVAQQVLLQHLGRPQPARQRLGAQPGRIAGQHADGRHQSPGRARFGRPSRLEHAGRQRRQRHQPPDHGDSRSEYPHRVDRGRQRVGQRRGGAARSTQPGPGRIGQADRRPSDGTDPAVRSTSSPAASSWCSKARRATFKRCCKPTAGCRSPR